MHTLTATPQVAMPSGGLTVDQTAQYLGVSSPTIRNWIRAGKLPAYRFGPRLLRIDPADIAALARPAVETAEEAPESAALAEYVQRIVDDAPALTAEQRDKLAVALRAAPDSAVA